MEVPSATRTNAQEPVKDLGPISRFVTQHVLNLWSSSSSSSAAHATATPPPSPPSDYHTFFIDFATRVMRATSIEPATALASLHYMERLRHRTLNPATANFWRSSLPRAGSEHRVWVAALMLADAYLNDNAFLCKSWAEVTAIPTAECASMRRAFLSCVDHDLAIGEPEFWALNGAFEVFCRAEEEEEMRRRRRRRQQQEQQQQQQQRQQRGLMNTVDDPLLGSRRCRSALDFTTAAAAFPSSSSSSSSFSFHQPASHSISSWSRSSTSPWDPLDLAYHHHTPTQAQPTTFVLSPPPSPPRDDPTTTTTTTTTVPRTYTHNHPLLLHHHQPPTPTTLTSLTPRRVMVMVNGCGGGPVGAMTVVHPAPAPALPPNHAVRPTSPIRLSPTTGGRHHSYCGAGAAALAAAGGGVDRLLAAAE
ncbi:hypothetical protein HDU67_004570, partial [Dinochytrium kinnereticum]